MRATKEQCAAAIETADKLVDELKDMEVDTVMAVIKAKALAEFLRRAKASLPSQKAVERDAMRRTRTR